MYRLVIDRHAQKQLGKIPPPHFNRIINAINDLAGNPRPVGCKKLTGRPGYRVRIGDYRVIYTIYHHTITIEILKIGNRKDIYD